ncbi:hypothetical protein [Parasulfitobacter algicola]|uniref:Uncharacterized protein n=1 Tax=Parasulfitobacter algicola TaxID=2614809 RepID=A0ABX2IXF4_9RHOB|nr:hypothetical protein [Sulfitobacter algicola]NSX56846.1 hypothetical protein [Sulfitobacter algicola]
MKNKWILDVLFDLRAYAQENGLMALAEHLEEASFLASAEIATLEERAARSTPANDHIRSETHSKII